MNLNGFCDTPLWIENLTWNTTTPDFTPCFLHTVLVWIPCGFFWLFAPLEFWKISSSCSSPNAWTFLNMGKTMINLFLLLLSLLDIVEILQNYHSKLPIVAAEISAPPIEFLTFLMAMILSLYALKKGVRASMVLPEFWLLETIAFILQLYSAILKMENTSSDVDVILIVCLSGKSLLVLMQLIISAFPERAAVQNDEYRNTCPMKNVSFFSYITFFWLKSILVKGYYNLLQKNNLITLCPDLCSETVSKRFDAFFCKKLPSKCSPRRKAENEVQEEFRSLVNEDEINECEISTSLPMRHSLFWTLFRTVLKSTCFGIVLHIIHVGCSFLQPYFLNLLLDFIQSDDLLWHGLTYAICFYLSGTVSQFFDFHHEYFMEVAALQVRTSLTSAVYSKIFTLSSDSRKKYTAGDIINLMSVDINELFEFVPYGPFLLGIPLTIAIGIYFLWQYLGVSCLAGLGVIVVLAPITVILAKICDNIQLKQMDLKDERIRIMNEILNGIKVLKLYAWERPFMKKIIDVRTKELNYIKKFYYVDSSFSFLWGLAPNLANDKGEKVKSHTIRIYYVSIACFTVYVLIDKNHVLNAQIIFVSLSLFNLLRLPMGTIPDVLARLIKAQVSLRRLEDFLNSEELDVTCVGNQTEQNAVINVSHASFSWELNKEVILKNININIKKSSLIAIVGQVGSGKSSLLSALLGEMYKVTGNVNRMGTVAYVPQIAWIQNDTLRNNIIFMREWNEYDYDLVLETCDLNPDLDILPGRDLTEIGEKGINLSGGQKQRISLARAVYQDADIYLLDDPLSAVDANVGKHLFNEVIGPNGLLQNKTRLLVTNSISILSQMDYVFVMDDGEIVEHGTYESLLERNGNFSKILKQDGHKVADHKCEDVLDKSDDSEEHKITQKVGNLEDGQLIDEEEMAIGKVLWSDYTRYVKGVGISVFLLVLFGFSCMVSFGVASGVWLSKWSSEKISQTDQDRNFRLLVYGLLVLGQGVFILLTDFVLYTGTTKAAAHLHCNLLDRIMKAPTSFFDVTPIGRIINRFSRDIESVDADIPQNTAMFLVMLFWHIATIVVMGLSSYILVIAFCPLIFIYYALLKLYVTTSRQLSRLESVTRSPIYDNFSESIAGISSIRSYCAIDYFICHSNERVDINNNCYILGVAITKWLQAMLVLTGGLIVLATALFAVFGRNVVDVGLIGLALTYSVDVTDDLAFLVRLTATLETSMVSVERIHEYCQIQQEADWDKSKIPFVSSWPREGTVTFCDYSTTYREGLNPVLHNLNLDIKSGEKVGIVGRTGAGKSSLILSLFRIIEPTNGCILIDYLDISQLGLHVLRSKLTVIPQDPVIFGGSIRMNLDPWEEYTDCEIWRALEHSHLKDFVSSFPNGLSYELTEGGSNISTGQRQLLCLTRALLRQTRILLLDEATASVDLETDKLVHDTISEEFSHCTIITIAHRLHTVLRCDRIIVLSNGCIIEEGPPQRLLLDKSSYFYNMARDAGLV